MLKKRFIKKDVGAVFPDPEKNDQWCFINSIQDTKLLLEFIEQIL
jgi:hypothetical protein